MIPQIDDSNFSAIGRSIVILFVLAVLISFWDIQIKLPDSFSAPNGSHPTISNSMLRVFLIVALVILNLRLVMSFGPAKAKEQHDWEAHAEALSSASKETKDSVREAIKDFRLISASLLETVQTTASIERDTLPLLRNEEAVRDRQSEYFEEAKAYFEEFKNADYDVRVMSSSMVETFLVKINSAQYEIMSHEDREALVRSKSGDMTKASEKLIAMAEERLRQTEEKFAKSQSYIDDAQRRLERGISEGQKAPGQSRRVLVIFKFGLPFSLGVLGVLSLLFASAANTAKLTAFLNTLLS